MKNNNIKTFTQHLFKYKFQMNLYITGIWVEPIEKVSYCYIYDMLMKTIDTF